MAKKKKKVKILSKNNFKFGIFWLDGGIERELTQEQFENNLVLCKNFNEMFKIGELQIVR
jgi:hypothetical protein